MESKFVGLSNEKHFGCDQIECHRSPADSPAHACTFGFQHVSSVKFIKMAISPFEFFLWMFLVDSGRMRKCSKKMSTKLVQCKSNECAASSMIHWYWSVYEARPCLCDVAVFMLLIALPFLSIQLARSHTNKHAHTHALSLILGIPHHNLRKLLWQLIRLNPF